MKETTVTTFEIDDKDYILLKKWIPENPCKKCPNYAGCCGCSERKERDELIKPLKQAGVFEVQQKVQEVKELQRKLKEIEQTIEADKRFIASKGFNLDRIFGTNMASMSAF